VRKIISNSSKGRLCILKMSFSVKMPRGIRGRSRHDPPPKPNTINRENSEIDSLLSMPEMFDFAKLDNIVEDQLLSFDENIEKWTQFDTTFTNIDNISRTPEDTGKVISGTGFLKSSSFIFPSPIQIGELSLKSDYIYVNNIVRINYSFSLENISLNNNKFTIRLSFPELPRAAVSNVLSGTGYGILENDGKSYLLLCKGSIHQNGEFQLIFVGSGECLEGNMRAQGSWSYNTLC
jgi:hypothetical protein